MTSNAPSIKTRYSIRSIKSACGFTSGFAFKSSEFGNIGHPVIKIKNIQSGKVTTEDSQFVSEEIINERLSKFLLNNRDVLIAMTGQGSVGRVGQLRIDSGERPVLNQRVGRFDPDEIGLNRDYLYYVISTKMYEDYFFMAGSGSGQPNLDPDTILSVGIPFPDYEDQLEIAKIFRAIDDKIELNRQINQTLEQIAQAIFKSWFVDFEPVRAKIAAKQNGQDPERAAIRAISGKTDEQLDQLSPDQLQQLAATATLFPDELVDSELGEIPKGWKEKKVSDWGDVVCGKTPPKNDPSNYGGNIPFIKIPDMHGKVFATITSDSLSTKGSQSQKKKKISKGSVCVSCIATVGQIVIASGDSHTNQQINSIVPSNMAYTPYLYFSMLGVCRT